MTEQEDTKNIGEIFRAARIEKKLSIEVVSKRTKIHPNILKAIESDKVKTFGTVYAKGFLKLYAEFLGLDKEEVLHRFQEELSPEEIQGAQTITFPGPKPARRRRIISIKDIKKIIPVVRRIARHWRIIAALLLALLVIGGVAKFVRFSREGGILSEREEVSKTAVERGTPEEGPEETSRIVASASSTTGVSKSPSSATTRSEEQIFLVVKAKERCWMQVKLDGKIVFQHVLTKGAAESWQADEKIELWVGNAGGIELELNGRLLEKIGRRGQMFKNVVVTKDGISINR